MEGWEIVDIYIYFLSVAVLNLSFELPAAAARHPHINAALYTEEETRVLDGRSDQLYFLARRALDYFLQIARWKTGYGLIALDTRPDRASLSGGRLFNLTHGGSFYSPAVDRTSVAPGRSQLTIREWQEISLALDVSASPPIWSVFFVSAQRRIDSNDLTAGTIDLAIAAESAIRQFRGVSMRKRKSNKMSELLANWSKLGFPAVSDLPWFRNLEVLFDVRNKIMHRGDDQRVDISFCQNVASAVENLITALS